MDLIEYLKTTPDFDNHIVFDHFTTLSNSIYNLLENSKEELKKYLEERKRIGNIRNRASRPINIYETKWDFVVKTIDDYLANQKIIGFHCTRLMNCEIEDVLKKGLTPFNRDFANEKVNLAYKMGLIPLNLRDKLLDKEEYFEESNRHERVHLTHNTLTLREEMGLYNFFKLWGGEAIYKGFEDNLYLQKIGVPCIIVAEVDYKDLIDSNFTQRLISMFVDNRHYYDYEFDSEIPHKVKVLTVIKKGNKLFNFLTNSNNWDETI